MKFVGLCPIFTISLVFLVVIQPSQENRLKRALFSTGKLLMPHFNPPAQQQIIPYQKYPFESNEGLLRPYRKTMEFSDRRRRLPNNQYNVNQFKRKRNLVQPKSNRFQREYQMPGSIYDAWAGSGSSDPMPSNGYSGADNSVYDLQYGSTGMRPGGSGSHSDCTKVPDGAAESLCQFAKEDAELDQSEEFLWVPLTTPLVGYPVNTRLERWYQKGCFSWKLKKCGGSPRYPLDKDCRFWTPEAVEKPGCPPILKTKKVSWKSYPANHCPCKWPCTTMFASIQECYEMPDPNATLIATPVKPPKPTSLRLTSAQAFQLCRAVERGGNSGPEPYETVAWIPIRLRMESSRSNKAQQRKCYSYLYIPCLGGPKDKEDCGKWRREPAACDQSYALQRKSPARGRSMGTPDCPCELPCIRFFDMINKCQDLGPAGRRDEAEHTKPESLLMKDAPRDGTTASLIECNFYENEIFCTIVPEGGGAYGEGRQGLSVDPEMPNGRPLVGRVKCELVDSRPTCRYVVD